MTTLKLPVRKQVKVDSYTDSKNHVHSVIHSVVEHEKNEKEIHHEIALELYTLFSA